MIREPITTDPLDDHRFPPDPWKLIETYPTPGDLLRDLRWSIYSLG